MRRIEAALLAIAALCIVLLGVVITANVVGRQFFGAGVPDAIVLVRELMVGVVVLPLAYVTAERAHISVEFVFNMVGARAKRAMTAFASLFAALSVPFILLAAWR
jgi:TRAP-type C4-dicarboxylate transport system permease small subunit